MECSRTSNKECGNAIGSNNTNKWNAQEPHKQKIYMVLGSNNTNKWNAQEHNQSRFRLDIRSNNTNKWNAQEPRN